MILKGDLKGFPENFVTFFRIPPAVSGPDGENTARSRNQSDCRICRIPPAHELRKKKCMYVTALCDWPKNLAPFCQPIRFKPRDLVTRAFARFWPFTSGRV